MSLRIRTAARVVVLDDDGRVLLVRFAFPGERIVWATVGGGLEADETHEDAARRELSEEAGLDDVELGPEIWTRTHVWDDGINWDGQTERYFLVRTTSVEPMPRHTWEELNAEWVTDLRWWAIDEIEASRETFAPTRLAALLRELVRDGPPAEPIDVGV